MSCFFMSGIFVFNFSYVSHYTVDRNYRSGWRIPFVDAVKVFYEIKWRVVAFGDKQHAYI